jgi:hypothetical protein
MKYVLVCPYAYSPYWEECLATIKLPAENILAVDNTTDNVGCNEGWNRGIDKLKEIDGDWLIVMSAAVRFGESGGKDMVEQLEKHPEAHIVHFAQKHIPEQPFVRGNSPSYAEGLLGWHLSAVRRDVIDNIGYFDPNFLADFGDLDYDIRVNKYYDKALWLILPVDAHGTTMNHGVKLGGAVAPAEPSIAYFATKFGVHPSAVAELGTYRRPFNKDNGSLAFFPPAHGRTWDGS